MNFELIVKYTKENKDIDLKFANIEYKDKINSFYYPQNDLHSLLGRVSSFRNINNMKFLLLSGADPNRSIYDTTKTYNGHSYYRDISSLCAEFMYHNGNNPEIIKLLLEFGADVNEICEINKDYDTGKIYSGSVLFFPINHHNHNSGPYYDGINESLELMIKYRYNLNILDSNGDSLLVKIIRNTKQFPVIGWKNEDGNEMFIDPNGKYDSKKRVDLRQINSYIKFINKNLYHEDEIEDIKDDYILDCESFESDSHDFYNNFMSLVELLITNYTIDMPDREGKIPLFYAKQMGDPQLIKLIRYNLYKKLTNNLFIPNDGMEDIVDRILTGESPNYSIMSEYLKSNNNLDEFLKILNLRILENK